MSQTTMSTPWEHADRWADVPRRTSYARNPAEKLRRAALISLNKEFTCGNCLLSANYVAKVFKKLEQRIEHTPFEEKTFPKHDDFKFVMGWAWTIGTKETHHRRPINIPHQAFLRLKHLAGE